MEVQVLDEYKMVMQYRTLLFSSVAAKICRLNMLQLGFSIIAKNRRLCLLSATIGLTVKLVEQHHIDTWENGNKLSFEKH